MRRRSLFTQGSEDLPLDSISPADSVAGDYCFYDKTADKVIIVDQTKWSADKYPSDRCIPIGVVVVPGTHNVYGDGSCGVMSLRGMSCDTPSTGSTLEQSMYWGVPLNNVSELTDYDVVCHIGNNGNPQNTICGTKRQAFLPSEGFDSIQCPHDTDAYYHYNDSDYYIPSPYLTDGERNPLYYQTTSPSSPENAMSDFDGIGNTEKIIAKRGTKDYNSWTPGKTTEADYPAASCCDMFHTKGIQQGNWYLPACGELGYIMPPFNKINDAIDKMRTAYGSSVGVELNTIDSYWSSTEYSNNYARRVYMGDGCVDYGGKDNRHCVRAWLRVSAEGVVRE